jgi:hypothetical protein
VSRNSEWEAVLAIVEAEAAFAESLLDATDPASAPAYLVAPSVLPAKPELPPLETMPAIPAELRERVIAVRDRIEELQQLLAVALQDAPWQLLVSQPSVTAAAPQFLDRRI